MLCIRKIFKALQSKTNMKKGRKITGGKYKASRKKKFFEKQGQPRIVKLGEKRTKNLRTRGSKKKLVSLSQETANITNKGKSKKAKIKNVIETPANRFLARQNILIKGAIIETEIGKAKITNRPSQEGIVQAILIEN